MNSEVGVPREKAPESREELHSWTKTLLVNEYDLQNILLRQYKSIDSYSLRGFAQERCINYSIRVLSHKKSSSVTDFAHFLTSS